MLYGTLLVAAGPPQARAIGYASDGSHKGTTKDRGDFLQIIISHTNIFGITIV